MDTIPRSGNDRNTRQFLNQKTVTVIGARVVGGFFDDADGGMAMEEEGFGGEVRLEIPVGGGWARVGGMRGLGGDDKDNDKGSKSRSQSMKEQAYNKEQRERPRPHELNDKSNLIDLMKECHQ
ncbi:hypothetical protein Tco_0658482 [Tanacetum coccineum]